MGIFQALSIIKIKLTSAPLFCSFIVIQLSLLNTLTMIKYSQFLESLSVLMIFILLLQLTGCYSTRVISASDLVLPYSEKYSYVIRTQNSKYSLINASISSDTLYGRINKIKSGVRGNIVRIFLSSDSLLKDNPDSLVKIPLDNIVKVVDVKFSTFATIMFIPVAFFIGSLIYVAIFGFHINVNLGG